MWNTQCLLLISLLCSSLKHFRSLPLSVEERHDPGVSRAFPWCPPVPCSLGSLWLSACRAFAHAVPSNWKYFSIPTWLKSHLHLTQSLWHSQKEVADLWPCQPYYCNFWAGRTQPFISLFPVIMSRMCVATTLMLPCLLQSLHCESCDCLPMITFSFPAQISDITHAGNWAHACEWMNRWENFVENNNLLFFFLHL